MIKLPLPNYTQTPNYIIDHWMSKLTHAEFKFIMLIVRLTCGFHRREAKISFGKFEKMCGIDAKTAKNISKKFEKMGWIGVVHGDHLKPNTYEILLEPPVEEEEDSNNDYLGVSDPYPRGVTPPPLGVSDPHLKERERNKKQHHQPPQKKEGGGGEAKPPKSKKTSMPLSNRVRTIIDKVGTDEIFKKFGLTQSIVMRYLNYQSENLTHDEVVDIVVEILNDLNASVLYSKTSRNIGSLNAIFIKRCKEAIETAETLKVWS
jgi:hypothetical protein